MANDGNTAEAWMLTLADRTLVMTKSGVNRLRFAVLLLFFRIHGRFPRAPGEIGDTAIAHVARQLGMEPEGHGEYDATSRTWKRHRSEIRALRGFREATVADGEALADWLRDHVVRESRDIVQLTVTVETHCRSLNIEPPATDRIERIIRAAVHAFDNRFCAGIVERLPMTVQTALDDLLKPSDGESITDQADGYAPAALMRLRADPGGPSVNSLQTEMAKLATIRNLALPANLFDSVSPHEIERYHQRGAVEAPYELRRHAVPLRLTVLAAFAHLRGRAVTDGLVDLLIETIHHIGARAERKVERELLEDLKRVTGKQNILFELAGAALDKPDGIVRDVVFPVAGEQTLRDLVKEWKATGPTYRTTLRTVIRNSYSGHYRRMVPEVLRTIDFRSNNEMHQPVIQALELLRRHSDTRLRLFPIGEDVPLDGIVSGLWREAVFETDNQGRQRVNRITYEICVLQALRERLRCKEIWVVGGNRYRNPDDDLPADFETGRAPYYEALSLPLDADIFIAALKTEMRTTLEIFNAGLPKNTCVHLTERKSKSWITLTPLDAQSDSDNIIRIKAELQARWPMTNLLDMVKESDLRLGVRP